MTTLFDRVMDNRIIHFGVRSRKGFTAIELLIVVAIIGILAALSIPRFLHVLRARQTADCTVNRITAQNAEWQYVIDSGIPSQSIDELIQKKYLATYPNCPAGGVYMWISEASEGNHFRNLGCSIHYFPLQSTTAPLTPQKTYNIDLGKDALKNTVKDLFASFEDYVKVWQSEQNKMPQAATATGYTSWNAALQADSPYAANRLSAKFWNEYFQYLGEKAINATNSEIADFKLFFKHDQAGNATPDIAGVYLKTVNGFSGIYFSTGEVISGNEKNGAYHYKNYIETVSYTSSGTAIGELKYKAIDGVK